jgi:hypothetical protein
MSVAIITIDIFVIRFEVFTAVTSGMLRRVALVKTDVSEEPSASFIRATRIGELGKTLAATSNRRTLRRNTTSVLTRATRRNIPEDTILHFCCCSVSYS